jgi:hypothetical protein
MNGSLAIPERTVIKARAATAPLKTVILECRMASMHAINQVLSPSSETMITDSEAIRPW